MSRKAEFLTKPHSKIKNTPQAKVSFDEDNPEWTAKDFAEAKPARDLPAHILAAFPKTKTRGPNLAPKKVPVSIRLSPDVLDYFKSAGPGWQGRIEEALRKSSGL